MEQDVTGGRKKKLAPWRGGPSHPRRGGPGAGQRHANNNAEARHLGRGRGTLPQERGGGLYRGRGNRPEARPGRGHPSSHHNTIHNTIQGAKRIHRDTTVKYGADSSLKPKPLDFE